MNRISFSQVIFQMCLFYSICACSEYPSVFVIKQEGKLYRMRRREGDTVRRNTKTKCSEISASAQVVTAEERLRNSLQKLLETPLKLHTENYSYILDSYQILSDWYSWRYHFAESCKLFICYKLEINFYRRSQVYKSKTLWLF